MKISCICFTPAGHRLAGRLALSEEAQPGQCEIHVSRGYGADKVGLGAWTKEHFAAADALLFIGAAGIAVRSIAPYVRSKATDPAVLVMDEAGRFVIPLLSGHIGGANRLAMSLAANIGATPVITTATDVNGLIALDDWAAANGLTIANPAGIKRVAARQLQLAEAASEGSPATAPPPDGIAPGFDLSIDTGFDPGYAPLLLYTDLAIEGALPFGIAFTEDMERADIVISPHRLSPRNTGHRGHGRSGMGKAGTGAHPAPAQPLHILPRCVAVGIGCRRGTGREAIQAAYEHALAEANIAEGAVCGVYSIDLKRDEAGLLEFCAGLGMELVTYPAEVLAQVQGSASASEFVRQTTGVDNVCERAALAGGGRLLLPKAALDGVTVALALRGQKLSFQE